MHSARFHGAGQLAIVAATLCESCLASAISYTGSLPADDHVVLIDFTVASITVVTLQTFSFGGGVDAAGQTIPSGGFEPVLSLFSSLGTEDLIAQDTTGGTAPANCAGRSIDVASGYCLDAVIQVPLPAGSYILALTEWDNLANGLTLADGFSQQNQGDFTGPEFTGSPGSCMLFTGTQRTCNWEVDLVGVKVTPNPEPETWLLALAGLGLVSMGSFRAKGNAQALSQRRKNMKTTKVFCTVFLVASASVTGLQAADALLTGDTYVSPGNAAINYGNLPVMNVGNGSVGLLSFDVLSALPATVAASNIEKATLFVYVNKEASAGSLSVAQATGWWTESAVTFSSLPTSAAPLGPVLVPGGNAYVVVDVTGIVQGWVGNPSTNFGLVLTSNGSLVIDTKESTTTSHPSMLKIDLANSGPVGPIGSQGPAGPQGLTGPIGPQGPAGPQGLTGPIGSQGPAGPQGLTGPKGQAGSQGPAGLQGAQGPAGPKGPAGSNGAPGATGPTGSTGAQGPAGPQGPTGSAGISNIEYIVKTGTVSSGFGEARFEAQCTSGKQVISGGCDAVYGAFAESDTSYFAPSIVKHNPNLNSNGIATSYTCDFRGGTGLNMPVAATAVCANVH